MMSQKFVLIRLFFAAAAIIASSVSFAAVWGLTFVPVLLGGLAGAILTGLLTLFEKVYCQINTRTIAVASLGLVLGYLLSKTFFTFFDSSLLFTSEPQITKLFIYLVCAYIGLVTIDLFVGQLELQFGNNATAGKPSLTHKKDEFFHTSSKEKLILADASALADPRIIDLAASGILDERLLIARAIINELYSQADNEEDPMKIKARRALNAIKKLEVMPTLVLQYTDLTPPLSQDSHSYAITIARELKASILTADISRLQQTVYENVRIININELSNSLKPLMQAGEIISIKIQRFGKEPRQGVGYLEDGTMVVVNGGASYIGKTIQSHVLSVKHSSTGARMIFCNAVEEMLDPNNAYFEEESYMSAETENSSSNYCAL